MRPRTCSAPLDYSFFLAGTMQGSRRGSVQLEQGYRTRLKEIILRNYPNARIVCPRERMHAALALDGDAIRESHAQLAELETVSRHAYDVPLAKLTATFVELSRLAGQCDVLVSYLPEHEASMGTAIEMWNAYAAGATVITISAMKQNLAVLGTSSFIVPTLERFENLLEDGVLEVNRRAPRAVPPSREIFG